MQLDAFDAFCLFLGKTALGLTVFFVLATIGTLLTSWALAKILGKDKIEADAKMMERMMSVLSANEALLAEKKAGEKK